MKLRTESVLDRLAAEEPCQGAVFTSFTFDPAFFEEHVLAAVLRLGSDPTDDAARYYDEACAALQERPVACVVDARMRTGGHRLPYDLREVRGRTFHPKVAVLLYADFARLSVGSGNLTEAGYGRNAEAFFVRDLHWDDPADVAVLYEVLGFLRALDADARPAATQLALVIGAIERRIAATSPATGEADLRFLHTEAEHDLLTQLLALVPTDATITRVGLLAPFFEQDDVDAAVGDDSHSVLARLAERAGKDAVLDLGVAWEPASVAPGARDGSSELAPGFWAMRDGEGSQMRIGYLTVTGATANSYRCIDAGGTSRLVPREELERRRAEVQPSMWPADRPTVFAPRRLVEVATKHVGEIATWLYPSPQMIESRLVDRPLHAKLLVLTFRRGKKVQTLVLLGSANASRKAMLLSPAQGGNVEACVAFVLPDEVTLPELVPGLVRCAAPVTWAERTFVEPPPLPSIPWIECAEYDAATETLTITWSAADPGSIADWVVAYGEQELGRGRGVPTGPLVVRPFTLTAASCEVVVRAHDGERTFPIIVKDLAALVVGGAAQALGLRELLALVGRSLSLARHRAVIASHGVEMADAVLTTLLGEGFAPTDVFHAWWSVAQDLEDPALSLAGFRLRLEGAIGAGAIWRELRLLVDKPGAELGREELWLYGAELRRELGNVEIPPGPDADEKRLVLEIFVAGLAADLAAIAPPTRQAAWLDQIVRFYGGAE
ncbi:MAG: hypothetical protein F9K40_00540 [Kofleriaceae bacterium]|nr:MAG: hypothetical protein F9K40_00540 [Kofleriaceae bacterium]MBZ0231765.1 hypothetical protein [Kofleriaceae bacterium]